MKKKTLVLQKHFNQKIITANFFAVFEQSNLSLRIFHCGFQMLDPAIFQIFFKFSFILLIKTIIIK